MLTFILWKWHKKAKIDLRRERVAYTAEHVNNMCRMLKRQCGLPYRVVCLTDAPEGIECETQPLPAPELLKFGACWHRLWLFSPEARYLGERLVSMDLDVVLVDRVDPVFSRPEPFVIWQGSYPGIPYCGSLWMLDAGSMPWLWEQFLASKARMRRFGNYYRHPDCLSDGQRIGSDQTWIALKVKNAPVWTSEDGVVSYRLEARRRLPHGARIVNFHGLEDPSLRSCQRESPWILEHWN